MCGIVGYIGNRDAYPVLIKGLKRLEYRGYDSAGVALLNGDTTIYKKKGKVSELEAYVRGKETLSTIGIGHTRWATHGKPSDLNAHPHQSEKGLFTIIHNGIIENYSVLKKTLMDQGMKFYSETDTEVLANLIEYIYTSEDISVEVAVSLALQKVVGAYGLLVISREDPNLMIAARRSSPLVIGLGSNEYFIASDATPIVEYTDRVIYLNNDDIALIRRDELVLKNLVSESTKVNIKTLDMSISEMEKQGYEHYMLKEIFEQPRSIMDTFRGRINSETNEIRLGGLLDVKDQLVNAKRIVVIACGTSWHAGLVGEYLIEDLARIPVEVEYASEFRYRNPMIGPDDVVLAISQSGETADTLAAIQLAREAGALVLGICNVAGSSISRETHAGVYTHAGIEIGVASTKAFTAQVTVLTMMAIMIGKEKGLLSEKRFSQLLKELNDVPGQIEKILELNEEFKHIAEMYKDASNALYLGRGVSFPVALEGALKLKEISYIHAEGYPAAEMKHGPIALIDEKMPVVFIATKDSSYEKIVSNIQEVKARNGVVIAIVTEGDSIIKEIADHVIEIPKSDESLVSLTAVVPLQLIAYHIALMRGCNVDQPRNLAKSVTVE
ncbi:MAG: glutamine--fructose-6-phosphate transaminase (isomerizing) [Bacteroidetes bacterium]|nr:MAG: glutamine--fructose-6-phosphate transaminase (isomerizing) [Bacteroidota bacterium]RLE00836.1 MAG: glutamine--fructose-6-phosphate transaminase (isomerizing) [Bacteroidota bacterium]